MGKLIHTDKAPKAVGPYSQAVKSGAFLFTSGQIPINPENGDICGADIEIQTVQVMENLKSILAAGGSSMEKVVKANCFLADMSYFTKFNEIYAKYV